MTTATAKKDLSATATWVVVCSKHDRGSADVHFIRKTLKDAERSANLFRQCGYTSVEVKQFTR
jgi:hypothetical protein